MGVQWAQGCVLGVILIGSPLRLSFKAKPLLQSGCVSKVKLRKAWMRNVWEIRSDRDRKREREKRERREREEGERDQRDSTETTDRQTDRQTDRPKRETRETREIRERERERLERPIEADKCMNFREEFSSNSKLSHHHLILSELKANAMTTTSCRHEGWIHDTADCESIMAIVYHSLPSRIIGQTSKRHPCRGSHIRLQPSLWVEEHRLLPGGGVVMGIDNTWANGNTLGVRITHIIHHTNHTHTHHRHHRHHRHHALHMIHEPTTINQPTCHNNQHRPRLLTGGTMMPSNSTVLLLTLLLSTGAGGNMRIASQRIALTRGRWGFWMAAWVTAGIRWGLLWVVGCCCVKSGCECVTKKEDD